MSIKCKTLKRSRPNRWISSDSFLFFTPHFLPCQQMKKISSSIWLSSRSCWVYWGHNLAGVGRDLPTGLGPARADLHWDVLGLRANGLLSSGAETGVKISNNSTTEKSNLKKQVKLWEVFVVWLNSVCFIHMWPLLLSKVALLHL